MSLGLAAAVAERTGARAEVVSALLGLRTQPPGGDCSAHAIRELLAASQSRCTDLPVTLAECPYEEHHGARALCCALPAG